MSQAHIDLWQTPEYRAKQDAYFQSAEGRAAQAAKGHKTARIRRSCNGCGMVSHPAAIASHQRSTGHSGYQDKVKQ